MTLTRRLFAASAAVLMISPAAAAPQKRAAVDWTKTVSLTADGGFRMGNPNAKVKLVEYGSLTCGHCRNFAEAATVPLKAYVKSGKVSFEYRNYILNGLDVAASLVARCGGAPRFFPVVDKLYATQPDWVGRLSAMPQAEKQKLSALPEGQRLARLADVVGITRIAAAHGISPAQAGKCLADKAALDRLGQMSEAASALGVNGTPTFFVNGRMVNGSDWPGVEASLKQAGG